VKVHPVWALVTDSLTLALLQWARPRRPARLPTEVAEGSDRRIVPLTALVGLVGFAVAAVMVSSFAQSNPPANASETFQKDKWIGMPLPLLEQIDVADEISVGNWVVLFVHYDCPRCQELMAEMALSDHDQSFGMDVNRLAIVELPPYGYSRFGIGSAVCIGRLDEHGHDLHISTPLVMYLRDGIVMDAVSEE
jgi:hypothetical protein